MQSIIFILILILAIIVMLYALMQLRNIRELKTKTAFAAQSNSIYRIEYDHSGDLGAIAENFNSLSTRYEQVHAELHQLEGLKSHHSELSGRVGEFESSISQINLITDIGKDITSSLGLNDILSKVFRYINSTMVTIEAHCMVEQNGIKNYFIMSERGIMEIMNTNWTEDRDNVLNWVFQNNKELVLEDAARDYERYIFKPVVTYENQQAGSVICIPFGFNTKQTGSLAVYSDRIKAFDSYHLDFVRSLASYISVAIDNAGLFEALSGEKKKSDNLLLNILPEGVTAELKAKGSVQPKQFNHVTVLFTDMVNFTGISETMSPTELVQEIHRNFTAFDAIIEKHGLEKIKTIGDAYLAVCGLPQEHDDHAIRVARAALDIREYMNRNNGKFQIRIGMHSGPVVAGIVGVKKYAYDIWGDTVNTAARMEQNSEAGKINISGSTYALVQQTFSCVNRGKIAAKNKGEVEMFFLEHAR